jgi:membrane-associated phospholipid phosphatase
MQPLERPRRRADVKTGSWARAAGWARRNRPLVWLVVLAVALVLFLWWLPPAVRLFFLRSIQRQIALVGMALGFGFLSLSLLWASGQRLDSTLFYWLNVAGRRPAWLDLLMRGFTELGNSLVAFALALYYLSAGNRLLAYGLILGTLTLWLVVEFVKLVARRRRPFLRLENVRVVGHRAPGRSFPSGHTSQAFFVATLLAGYFALAGWEVLLLYAVAVLVGLTRIYVGAHYPRDVLAGALLGSAWGLLGGILPGFTF